MYNHSIIICMKSDLKGSHNQRQLAYLAGERERESAVGVADHADKCDKHTRTWPSSMVFKVEIM